MKTTASGQYFEVWSEEEGGDENSELQLTSEGFALVSVTIEELCQEILGLGEDEIVCTDHNDLAEIRSDLVEFLNGMAAELHYQNSCNIRRK